MAANIEMEPGAPGQQPYEQILELRKQLEVGPKHVKLQGEDTVYVMKLSSNAMEGQGVDVAMGVPLAQDNVPVQQPGGAIPVQQPDGAKAVQQPDGAIPVQQPDGARVSKKPKQDEPQPEEDEELEPGCVYVQGTRGHGGFGIVYKAKIKREEKTTLLCLKMGLHQKKYKSEKERAQGQKKVNKSIEREAKHYRKLAAYPHSNVVSMQFCCVSQDYNEVFLALDYCQGITLRQLVYHYRNKNLPAKLLHKIILESADAVGHCLSHGIVHCDIKPSNIIYDGMDKPLKLIDFGCAVNADEGIDPSRDIAGTFEYMPPEIILHGLQAIDQYKSDVYGLGALLFKMLLRRTPWYHHEPIRVAWNDRKRRHEVKDYIISELKKSSEEAKEQFEYTSLQSIVTDKNSIHFSCMPEQCNLISRMLSFHPSERPSCKEVIETVGSLRKRKTKSTAPEGSSEADDLNIPAPVFSLSTSDTAGQGMTSTVTKDFTGMEVDEALLDREYNSSFYGPSSDKSLIAEDLTADYAQARVDEWIAREVEMIRMMQESPKVPMAHIIAELRKRSSTLVATTEDTDVLYM